MILHEVTRQSSAASDHAPRRDSDGNQEAIDEATREDFARLNMLIPEGLHRRIKLQAIAEGKNISDVLLHLAGEDNPDPERLLPDRWAVTHPDAAVTHRIDESRQKRARQAARRNDRRRHPRLPAAEDAARHAASEHLPVTADGDRDARSQ